MCFQRVRALRLLIRIIDWASPPPSQGMTDAIPPKGSLEIKRLTNLVKFDCQPQPRALNSSQAHAPAYNLWHEYKSGIRSTRCRQMAKKNAIKSTDSYFPPYAEISPMRIILINLARAPERRRKMAQQFAALGLNYEILEATDGRMLTDADRALVDHRRRRRITPYPLTDNEIGCWLSHRRAMLELLDSSAPMAMIAEDDARLSVELPSILTAIAALETPFDVVDLHRNFKRGEIFTPSCALLPGNALGRVGYTHMNLTAYVISRAGAEKFTTQAKRFVHAVDKELHRYWANGLDIYGLERPVAEQDDGGHSYIDETRNQNNPAERQHYPKANALPWRARRMLSKLSDSIGKRLAYRQYRRQAQ